MAESPKLALKSPSIESLSSSVHTVDDIKSVEGLLLEAIELGKIEELNSILNDESIDTLVLQILLMKTIPNNDEKYCLEPDPSVNHLLGNSFTNLNFLQLVCVLGDEDMAIALFDFLLRMTVEMDSKILLLEFIHRTFGRNNTILHLAAYLGFTHLVQKLIESGASVYVRNDNNYKPIDLVDDHETSLIFNNTPSAPPRSATDNPPKRISRQNTPTKLQIPSIPGSNAPPKKKKSVKFDSSSTLLDICKHGLPKTMTMSEFKEIITKCNYLEILSPQKNMSLVHVASSYGHLDILKALLETSTELLNQQDVEGWSPAHCASAEGHLNVLRLLGKYGPQIGNNLWEYYAEHPIDLDLKTYDGESIEDVALPENHDQVSKIIHDLRPLQVIANTLNPEHQSLNSLDNILSDPEIFVDACSSVNSSNKDILGSITEALNLSSESIIAPQQPHSNNFDHVSSVSHNSNKENDHTIIPSLTMAETKYILPEICIQTGEKSFSDSAMPTITHPTVIMMSSTLTLSPSEISCSNPDSLDTRRYSSQDLELKSISVDSGLAPKSMMADDIRPPPKSPRKPFSNMKTTLSKDTQIRGLPESDTTIYEPSMERIPIDPTLSMFKSRNPFLEVLMEANVKANSALPVQNEKSIKNVTVQLGITNANPGIPTECEEDLSGLTIRERMKRLKQLGVQ